ncbi:thioesterase family protein [Microbulbifer sp.]|uniref:acyl-CoA thioesterase n=1 Tax=Microbulbifer sp. TaxID=1908541 RepID=UPI0025891D43|nr:thioesterase family protein [Microbulbifer sp.]
MKFSDILRDARGTADTTVPEGWMQGRAAFGGLAAALVYEAIAARSQDAPLRSLTTSFVAPAKQGKLERRSEVLRRGSSVTQIEGRAVQEGQVVTAALASFGSGRDSAIRVSLPSAPTFTAPDACQALPDIDGLTPEFARHFDYRIAEGALPFSGISETRLGGWMRFRNCDEPVTVSHLLALIDAWPPAVLQMLSELAPASSLTWTLEACHPLSQRSAGDWWQYQAEIEQAGDGYAVIQAKIWDADGKPVALSRQTVTVFA